MPAISSDALLANLAASNLLGPEQMTRVRTLYGAQGSAFSSLELVQRLVDRGVLTRWQGKMLLAGRRAFFLGRYKLVEQLGQGGMGTVFKAEQGALARVVAIKVMAARFVKDRDAIARFHQEIQAAAVLSHPNIVHAYDADCFHGTHFLVMEYVAGEDLDSICKREGTLPIGAACEYVRQAAEGLQHAHERGMTHRDIKPANLLLTANAESELPLVKILDMGLARISTGLDDAAGITQTGQVIGTPDFISPEQAMDTKRADIRSDIYSLGCTLFRLISGKVPFSGGSVMEKLMARAMTDAPSIRSLRPEIPVELDAIIARMLARDPALRFQTPVEVAAALAPFSRRLLMYGSGSLKSTDADDAIVLSAPSRASFGVGTAGSQATPAPSSDPGLDDFLRRLATQAAEDEQSQQLTDNAARATMPTEMRPPAAAPLAGAGKLLQSSVDRHDRDSRNTIRRALMGVGGLLLLAVAVWAWDRLGRTVVIVDWDAADRDAGEIEIDGRQVKLARDGELRFTGDPGKRKLRTTRKGYHPVEVTWNLKRGETKVFHPEWQPTRDTRRSQQLGVLQKDVEKSLENSGNRDPGLDALRERIADFRTRWLGTPDSLAAAGLLKRLPSAADSLFPEQIAPEELQTLGSVNSSGSHAELVAILGENRLTHGSRIRGLAYHPQGAFFATAGEDRVIRLWNPANGREVRALPGNEDRVIGVAFSNDGQRLFSSSHKDVSIWEIESGTQSKTQSVKRGKLKEAERPEVMAVSPDGKTWALGQSNGTIRVFEFEQLAMKPEQRAELKKFSGHGDGITGLAFRGDGRILASSSRDGTVRVWDVASGTTLHVLKPSKARVKGVAFPGSGTVLASCGDGGTVMLWDSDSGKNLAKFSGVKTNVEAVAWGRKSDMLATADQNGSVILWNPETAKPRHTLPGNNSSVTALAFSPDDQVLAASYGIGTVRLFQTANGEELVPRRGHHGPVEQLAVGIDGKQLYSCGADAQIRIWDLAGGQEAAPFRGLPYFPVALALSPDGKRFAVGYREKKVSLWDLPNGTLHHVMESQIQKDLPRIEFSPDAKLAAFSSRDEVLSVWDVETAKQRHEFQHANKVRCFTFSPDGRTLAASDQKSRQLKLWDIESGKERRTLGPFSDEVYLVRFHPDGKSLAVHTSGLLRLYDAKTGAVAARLLDNAGGIAAIDYSLDGTRLAAGYSEGIIRIWDANGGELRDTLRLAPPGYSGTSIRTIAFTPDSRHLLAGNSNGTIYVLRIEKRGESASSSTGEKP